MIKFFAVLAGSFVGLVVLCFSLELGGLKWAEFFNPKWEDVRRETFERNKSYVHGSIQDLGKRYREWLKASDEDKAALGALVASEFAEFDASLIDNDTLRSFLIQQRGF